MWYFNLFRTESREARIEISAYYIWQIISILITNLVSILEFKQSEGNFTLYTENSTDFWHANKNLV